MYKRRHATIHPATPPSPGGRGPARTMVPDSFPIVVVGQ
jgi:hypothetical protein